MRKSDKKLEKQIIQVLTNVCETVLEEIEGFQWLTHMVNFANFPKSLKVVCVFESEQNLAAFNGSDNANMIAQLIQSELKKHGIKLDKIRQHVLYDSEERCNQQHGGNWSARLASAS